MRNRRLQTPCLAVTLLLVLVAVAVGIWGFNQRQTKAYVLHAPSKSRLAHSGVRFAYPANFIVREVVPGTVNIRHLPANGFAARIEVLLHMPQAQDWNGADVFVKYAPDESGIDKAEAEMRKSFVRTTNLSGQLRRVDHRLGPALKIDVQFKLPAGTSVAMYGLYIFPKQSRVTTSPFAVYAAYPSPNHLGSQPRQIVDEIAPSLQDLTL